MCIFHLDFIGRSITKMAQEIPKSPLKFEKQMILIEMDDITNAVSFNPYKVKSKKKQNHHKRTQN